MAKNDNMKECDCAFALNGNGCGKKGWFVPCTGTACQDREAVVTAPPDEPTPAAFFKKNYRQWAVEYHNNVGNQMDARACATQGIR